jgi:hypothetical protein
MSSTSDPFGPEAIRRAIRIRREGEDAQQRTLAFYDWIGRAAQARADEILSLSSPRAEMLEGSAGTTHAPPRT